MEYRAMKTLIVILLLLTPTALCQDKNQAEGAALLASAEGGDTAAQTELGGSLATGKWTPRDYKEFARWYRLLANQGDAESQMYLGLMYSVGQGVPEDSFEAAQWLRKAADQGRVDAQYELGKMYYNGSEDRRTPQDYAEAAHWYRKAADQGQASALFSLGLMCYKGQSVPQDYIAAHMWINLAASRARGDDQKKYVDARELLAKEMTAAQVAEAQRRASQWKPKSGGGR